MRGYAAVDSSTSDVAVRRSELTIVPDDAVGVGAVGSRILVIDGNLLTAEAITMALGRVRYSARFAFPVTVEHVGDLAAWQPSLALLDIDSVDPDTGVRCVGALVGAGVPLAVMAGPRTGPLIGRCLVAGAASVVDKGSQLSELVGVIDRILGGEVVCTEETKQRLMQPYLEEARARRSRLAPFDVLTEREKCVLAQLMDGFCADEIAREGYVSISTVRSQIKSVLQKMGVNSQLAVAALARQAGWSLAVRDGPDEQVS